jgi:isopenicillin N synthase-like dioxygenase
VWRDGQWCPINPTSGTFIVNFGCAMEILTRQTKAPVSAVAHRVIEQIEDRTGKPDRFSYGLFVDSSLDEKVSPGLFRLEPGKGLVFETSFKDFLDKILSRTYERDTQGLY